MCSVLHMSTPKIFQFMKDRFFFSCSQRAAMMASSSRTGSGAATAFEVSTLASLKKKLYLWQFTTISPHVQQEASGVDTGDKLVLQSNYQRPSQGKKKNDKNGSSSTFVLESTSTNKISPSTDLSVEKNRTEKHKK